MRILPIAITLILVLALVGCAAPGREGVEHPASTTPGDRAVNPTEGVIGTLAYVGTDGNIWVTSPGEGWTRQVTRDATASPEGQGRSYHRVAWTRDGALAFASVTRTQDQASSELLLQEDLDKAPTVIARNEEHFVIYMYPIPSAQPDQSDLPALSYLVEEANGVGLHLVFEEPGKSPRDLLVSVGRPFYFSWSPDGERLLWHTGGALRHNPAAELALYDIQHDHRVLLPYAPGDFQAPAWSPGTTAWLSVVEFSSIDRLALMRSGVATDLAETTAHGSAFVWSPDGERIAYASRPRPGSPFYGPIWTIDVEADQARQITDDAFDVLGFFWSPDGYKIAYLSRLELPSAVWMQWRVFDLRQDRDRGFSAFHPSPLMRFVIHSFDQYAQSHRFWSPDSRHLIYADRDGEGADRIWLVDVEAERGADPVLIDEGSIGVWSWN